MGNVLAAFVSVILTLAGSYGLHMAVQEGQVTLPFPDKQMEQMAGFGGLLFVVSLALVLGLQAVVCPATPASGGGKKKKKKAKSSSAKAASASGSGKQAASKPADKQKAKKQEAAKEEPKAKASSGGKGGKGGKGKKGGKAAQLQQQEQEKKKARPAPSKAKKAGKPSATNNTKWALLADDDDEPPTPKKSGTGSKASKGGKAAASFYDSDSDGDDFGNFGGAGKTTASKAALRRRRKAENKEDAYEEAVHAAKAVPDEDGFVTHTVKRRVRRAGGGGGSDNEQADSGYGGYGGEQRQNPTASGHSVEINVPSEKFGLLIGSKGATLIKLQDSTGCRVDVPKDDSTKKTVTVSGPKEGVARCQAAINSLLKAGYSTLVDPDIFVQSLTLNSGREVSLVVGEKGATIKMLQEKLSIRINTPDRDSGSFKLTITGTDKANVDRAKAQIKMLCSFGYNDLMNPGWTHEFVAFPQSQYDLLIGPNGHMIKNIQNNTSTQLKIPGPQDDEDRVMVVGLPDNIKRAKIHIDRLLDPEHQAAKQAKKNPKAEEEDPYDW